MIQHLPSPLSTLPLVYYSPAADFLYTGYITFVPFTEPLVILLLIAWNSVPQISTSTWLPPSHYSD